ncbi:hypothetical protein F4604DRAFT_1884162 [Suillus subluteus]|nr:hypothetical protein F4604DRAFT_1884162 [Suillus subluteus]
MRANEKARDICATETASTFALKEKGVFTDVSRTMVRDLVANLDVPLRSINSTINVVAEALGDEVEGDVSKRNGTTHKNINHQCHHVTLTLPDGQTATQLAGIPHEVNHTSKTQLHGWKNQAAEMYSTYNDGMLTDHAEDQKKLVRLFAEWKRECKREVRGKKALARLPPADVVRLLSEMMENLHSSEVVCQLRMTLGEEQFTSLSSAEKEAVDFFVWAGCCMHKELNAAKGGNTRMRAWWEQNSVDGPVLLMNKDNVAVASGGSSAAKDQAVQVSTGGGQKTLDLAGSVFRHKDDKKGQHDSLQYYLEMELGFTSQWPDTNATCKYLFLEIILFKKESRTHTNIEQNVFRGFSCLRTEEEITCWASYNQCLTHPYL